MYLLPLMITFCVFYGKNKFSKHKTPIYNTETIGNKGCEELPYVGYTHNHGLGVN